MLQHIVSITLWPNIDKLNNSMQFYGWMDIFLIVLKDLHVMVAILNMLSEWSFSYLISNQIFVFINRNIGNVYQNDNDDQELVNINNGPGIVKAGYSDSAKLLITSNVVVCEATNGASHLALVINVNDSYLPFGELLLALERNTIAKNTTCKSKAKDDYVFEECRIISRNHRATIQYEKYIYFSNIIWDRKQKFILLKMKQQRSIMMAGFDTMITLPTLDTDTYFLLVNACYSIAT